MSRQQTQPSIELGDLIDEYGEIDRRIKKLDRKVTKLKSDRHKQGQKLMALFTKRKLNGATGKRFKSSISRDKHPTIKDWNKVAKYVIKNNALDLFQRRISKKAYMDRIKNGEQIPGTEVFESTRLNIRSIK